LSSIPRYERYTVQPGDSLWKIHQKYPQNTLASLIAANGGKETIYVGQVLHIPL
jgi:LysM repeat protein